MLKEIGKTAWQAALCLAAGIFLSVLALVAVYCLPIQPIYENLQDAEALLTPEPNYPQALPGYYGSAMDDFTDRLMCSAAAYSTDAPLDAAMKSYVIANLPQYLAGDEPAVNSYTRYWHGYLIFLKPLLMLFSLETVKQLLLFGQLALFGVLLMLLARGGMEKLCLPLAVCYAAMMPAVTLTCLQFSTAIDMAFLACIVLLVLLKKANNCLTWRSSFFFFLVVGMLTSYIDLLTVPLLTFLLPFSLLAFADKRSVRLLISSGMAWCLGYAVEWASKWLLGPLLCGTDGISSASYAIGNLTAMGNDKGETFDYAEVLHRQWDLFFTKALLLLMMLWGLTLLVQLVRSHKQLRLPNLRQLMGTCLPYLLLLVLPFAWYFVMSNHSHTHAWFTYRVLCGGLFALMALGQTLCDALCGQEQVVPETTKKSNA